MAVSVGNDKETEEKDPLTDVLPVDEGDSAPADDTSSGASEAPDEPDAGAISDGGRSLAKEYGFDPDAFGSDDNIRAAAAMLDKQAVDYIRQSQERQRQASNFPPGVTAPKETAKPEPKSKLDFDKLFPKEEIDEKLVAGMKAMYEHLYGEFSERDGKLNELGTVRDQVKQIQEFHAQQEGLRFERDMDIWFSGLGDEWKGVFGDEPMRSLRDHVPSDIIKKQSRHKIVEQLEMLQEVDRMRGRAPKPLQDYAHAALRIVFSKETDTAARRKVTTELSKRAKGAALAHGKGKVVQPVEPEERAYSALKRALGKHGFANHDTSDDE